MSDIAPVESVPQQLPIGEARKLGEHARVKPKDRLAIFSQVENRVLKINPEINFPFKIKEGKPTPVGIFAEKGFSRKLEFGQTSLEVLPRHLRTALLARAIFSDKEGNLYRDVDIKGMGFLGKGQGAREVSYKAIVSPPGRWASSISGLLDKESAFYDYENGEDLSKLGVRVARTVAIIELNELIVDGERVSIDEARKRDLIDKDFQPVLQIRAFGTRARIRDLLNEEQKKGFKPAGFKGYESTSKLLLEDAKKLVAQELGKEPITDEEYLEWFATTLGKNLGLIHKEGWSHGSFNDQNLTLDGRIADFDALETSDERWEDQNGAREALFKLFVAVTGESLSLNEYINRRYIDVPPLLERLEDLYFQSYQSAKEERVAA